MGAYHLTEKCVWGVESIMVSDLPVYSWNATSVSVWIQKRAKFYRESGTEKEPRNWLMVNNIPFGSYQPEWKDYLKTYSSIFGLPSIRNFRNFLSNGTHSMCRALLRHLLSPPSHFSIFELVGGWRSCAVVCILKLHSEREIRIFFAFLRSRILWVCVIDSILKL